MLQKCIQNLYQFHVLATALIYLPGLFISLFFLDYEYRYYSITFILILIAGFLFSYLGWNYARKRRRRRNPANEIISLRVFYILILVFIATAIYIFTQTPPALFSSGDAVVVSELRAASTKGKAGIDSIINVLHFASSYVGLPSIVLVAFWREWKTKYLLLFISILSLLLSLQKARAIIIFIPLLVMYASRGYTRRTITIFSGFFLLIYIASNLVGLDNSFFQNISYDPSFIARATSGSDRMLFANPSIIEFIINRVVWIPTITALDWLRFHSEVLNADFLWGSTTPILYQILGHSSRFRIENEVFKYQFNAASESLGSANSHYLLDAYINFGIFGVIAYAFIFGFLLGLTSRNMPKPIYFCIYNYAYTAVIGNLHSLLFGGGWLIFAFLAIKKDWVVKKIRICKKEGITS